MAVHPVPTGDPRRYERWRSPGLIVDRVWKDSPAAKAGIQVGDVLFKIERNFLFSRDDLWDFLATSMPGAEATVSCFRAGSERKIAVKLEQVEDSSVGRSTFPWDYAGLAQLAQALTYAEITGKNALVGLFGSDT